MASKSPRVGVTNVGFSDNFVVFVLIAGLLVGGFIGFGMPEKERRAVINQAKTAWEQINKMISGGKASYATSSYYVYPSSPSYMTSYKSLY